jgi:hypothetical protein
VRPTKEQSAELVQPDSDWVGFLGRGGKHVVGRSALGPGSSCGGPA